MVINRAIIGFSCSNVELCTKICEYYSCVVVTTHTRIYFSHMITPHTSCIVNSIFFSCAHELITWVACLCTLFHRFQFLLSTHSVCLYIKDDFNNNMPCACYFACWKLYLFWSNKMYRLQNIMHEGSCSRTWQRQKVSIFQDIQFGHEQEWFNRKMCCMSIEDVTIHCVKIDTISWTFLVEEKCVYEISNCSLKIYF